MDKRAGENEEVKKKPMWETVPEDFMKEFTKEASKQIAHYKKLSDDYESKANTAEDSHISTAKQFFYLASLVFSYHAHALEGFGIITEGLCELSNDLSVALQKLEKDMEVLRENAGEEFCVVKTDLEAVKATVKNPIEKISKYIEESEKTEARKKKIEDEILDWALRSH